MDYDVLGTIQLRDGPRTLALPGRQTTRVLAALLLERGQPVSADTLIERLWDGRGPATARTAVQVHVSNLRKAMRDDGALTTTRNGYVLNAPTDALDAARFERLIRAAEDQVATDPRAAIVLLDQAIELWRGTPFLEVASEWWAQPEVIRLTELRSRAIDMRADAALALGQNATIVHRLRAAVDDDPLREQRWEQLMLALYRSGRQAEALRAYQEARQRLDDELGVEPGPRLRDLEHRILWQDPSLATDRPARTSAGNLISPTTSTIGREAELRDIASALESTRLVTLTGPGGVGKSRLATVAAREAARRFVDGVWLVDLSAAPVASLVMPAIASALGLVEPGEHGPASVFELVGTYVRTRRLLLVLDSCEHVAAEVAVAVEALLATAPGVSILATSRMPLGVQGESPVSVRPLAVPAHGAAADASASSPAVRLFVERSMGHRVPSAEDLRTIGELCRYLEGLPLAIELAAATSRGLAVRDLLARFTSRLALAGPSDGAGALHATIDWSHTLLASTDRVVLRRVAAFASGFTLDGATAVAASEGTDAVVGSIARLVHASLVVIDASVTPPRYRLFDSVREYALDHLRLHGEEPATRTRLTDYLISRARSVRPRVTGIADYAVLPELDAEHDNVRAAFEDLLASDNPEEALRLAVAMGDYWYERGHWGEGLRLTRRALDAYGTNPTRLRAMGLVTCARAVSTFAGIGSLFNDLVEAHDIIVHEKDALTAERFGIVVYLALAAAWVGRPDDAAAYFRESREEAARLHDEITVRWATTLVDALAALGKVLTGDVEGARAAQYAAADAFIELGDPGYAGRILMYAGTLSRILDDTQSARRDLERSVELCSSSGSWATSAHAQFTLALLAAEHGDANAAELLHASHATLARLGDVRCGALVERVLGGLALDDGEVEAALQWLRGSLPALAETDERAFAVALADIATAYATTGRMDDARTLVTAAGDRLTGMGIPLTPHEQGRIDAALDLVGSTSEANPLDVQALLEVAEADHR